MSQTTPQVAPLRRSGSASQESSRNCPLDGPLNRFATEADKPLVSQSEKPSTSSTPESGTTPRGSASSAQPRIIHAADVKPSLAESFSESRKWWILAVLCLQQISMNLNAAIFGSGVKDLESRFGLPAGFKMGGVAGFLLAYAFGCELWAPWSEETGRKWTLQSSLALVNVFQVPIIFAVAFARPQDTALIYGITVACRVAGGLSSAGGSVTLGVIADMWDPISKQKPLAVLVCASCLGAVIGAIVGGFVESFLGGRWIFVVQLGVGAVTQALHYFFVPETRSLAIVTAKAKAKRKAGENVWSQSEMEMKERGGFLSMGFFKHACSTWARPFIMLFTEPIVAYLSLLSGFADALIFSSLDSLGMVMRQWGFAPWQNGLLFSAIALGYVIGLGIWLYAIKCGNKKRDRGDKMTPEYALKWLVPVAPLLVVGLFMFAWTGIGPPMPWVVPAISLVLIGVSNYAIYGATVDYMIAAYGAKYSASATGGNGFSRDFLAGLSAFYTMPLYSNIGPESLHLQLATTVLGVIGLLLIPGVWLFYRYGEWFRARSTYAKEVEEDRLQEGPEPITGEV